MKSSTNKISLASEIDHHNLSDNVLRFILVDIVASPQYEMALVYQSGWGLKLARSWWTSFFFFAAGLETTGFMLS